MELDADNGEFAVLQAHHLAVTGEGRHGQRLRQRFLDDERVIARGRERAGHAVEQAVAVVVDPSGNVQVALTTAPTNESPDSSCTVTLPTREPLPRTARFMAVTRAQLLLHPALGSVTVMVTVSVAVAPSLSVTVSVAT